MNEIKIRKARNGYIIENIDFFGDSVVFTTFADMMEFLFDYFNEKVKL